MLEIMLGIAMCVLMAKIASADEQSPMIWGALTFLLCVGSIFFVPLPFVRMMLAGGTAFVGMIIYKIVFER